eukprot:3939868-Rhodomonas_salina.1
MTQALQDFLCPPKLTPDHAVLFKRLFSEIDNMEGPWTDKISVELQLNVGFDPSASKFTSKLTDLHNEEGAPFWRFLLACNYRCYDPEHHEIANAEFGKKSKKNTPVYSRLWKYLFFLVFVKLSWIKSLIEKASKECCCQVPFPSLVLNGQAIFSPQLLAYLDVL